MNVITHPTISADTTGTTAVKIAGRPMLFQFDGDFGSGSLNVQMSLDGIGWHTVLFTDSTGALISDIDAAGLYVAAITGLYMRFVMGSSTDPAVIPKTAELLSHGGY